MLIWIRTPAALPKRTIWYCTDMKTFCILPMSRIIVFFCLLSVFIGCGEFVGTDKDEDPDTGSIEKLEIFLCDYNLHQFYNTVAMDNSVSCSVIYNKWHGDGTIKVRGDSSRLYLKKSFMLKVDGKKYVLERGEENGGIYNRIAMRAYQLAGVTACDTESIALYVNEEYLGCYNLITYYDEDIMGGELYKCYFTDYDHMENNHPITSLSKKKFPDDDNFVNLGLLIAAVVNLSDEEWHKFVLENVDVEHMAAYMAVHDFLTVIDTGCTNFYMHYDGKYRIVPWDNEQCLRENRNNYYPCNDNQLIRRLATVAEIKTAYNQIMQALFTGGGAECILDQLSAEATTMFDNLVPAMENDPVFHMSRQEFMQIKAYVLAYLDKNTGRAAEADKLILH